MEFPKKIGPYTIFGTLGYGGFGQVYIGRESKTLINYAIKASSDRESLKKEYKILRKLCQLKYFMRVYEYGVLEDFDYIVMELLGKNLEYKNNECLLSLQSISAICIELINRVEGMHNSDIIHRDIKPSQFLLSDDKTHIYLVDYGMAAFFRTDRSHKAFKTRCRFKGSVTFASINNHMGFKQSRRDDLESLCYSLLYLLKGELPWKTDPSIQGFKKWKMILNQKVNIDRNALFKDLPSEFEALFKYSRKLLYEQTPNYSYLKNLFLKHTKLEKIYMNFDWFLYPERFNKVKCFVVSDGGKTFLHIKNDGAEFVSKRRDTRVNVDDLKKNRKSLGRAFSENKKQGVGNVENTQVVFDVESLSEINSNTTKSIFCGVQEKNGKVGKNIVKKIKNKRKGNDKKRVKTCENIDNIDSPDIQDRGKAERKLQIMTFPEIPSLIQDSFDDECLTPKDLFPEFLNKNDILVARDLFSFTMKSKPNEQSCCIC